MEKKIFHSRTDKRILRQKRVRRAIKGTDAKPRLCVFRSHRYIYAQIISDESNKVLGAFSSKELAEKGKGACTVEAAKTVGMKIAEVAKQKNIEDVVFDRNGYLYHGRIKAVADGAREAGLKV
jgi:large subunit ribosomal protein L18